MVHDRKITVFYLHFQWICYFACWNTRAKQHLRSEKNCKWTISSKKTTQPKHACNGAKFKIPWETLASNSSDRFIDFLCEWMCTRIFLWFRSFRDNVQHPITFLSCFTIAKRTNIETKCDAMQCNEMWCDAFCRMQFEKRSNNKIYWKLIYISLVLANKYIHAHGKSIQTFPMNYVCSLFAFIGLMSNMLCDLRVFDYINSDSKYKHEMNNLFLFLVFLKSKPIIIN